MKETFIEALDEEETLEDREQTVYSSIIMNEGY